MGGVTDGPHVGESTDAGGVEERILVLRAPFVVEARNEESRAEPMPLEKRGHNLQMRPNGIVAPFAKR